MKLPPRVELKNLGFEVSGKFLRDGNQVKLELTNHRQERGVYAFVIGESVRYIGETADKFSERAKQYAKPSASQTTNVRVHKFLKSELVAPGTVCEVWFLPDATIEHGRLYLDLHGNRVDGPPDRSTVKRVLIARWDPNWNRK